MAKFEIVQCDLCKRKADKKDLDKSDLTTSNLSIWLHNERDGYPNTEGQHYNDICPDCTEIIKAVVSDIVEKSTTKEETDAKR